MRELEKQSRDWWSPTPALIDEKNLNPVMLGVCLKFAELGSGSHLSDF